MTFSLTILGSSSALPTPNRFSTAQVLNILERFFLIDCGEGTQIQLRRFKIKFSRINHVFISHLHGDHFLGIYGFISSQNLLGRKNPLHIYGSQKLKELIDQFIGTLDRGIAYELVFHPLSYAEVNTIFEDEKLTIKSIPLRHRIPTCGFLFEEKPRLRNLKGGAIRELNIPVKQLQAIKEGADYTDEQGTVFKNETLTNDPKPPRSYAFISDTAKKPSIIPIINGVDLLYHEATFSDEGKKRAKETGHTTSRQAGKIAREAKVKKLIIGHFSHRYKSLDELLAQAQEVFPNTEIVHDGAIFEL